MKKNQSGIGVVGLLVILVTLSLVGLSTWMFIGKSQTKNTEANDSVQIAQNKPSKNDISTKKNLEDEHYLIVKEWGVKYKLSEDLKDASYSIESPKHQYITVHTPRLLELSSTSKACSGAKSSISLNRAMVGDDRFGSPWTEDQLQTIGIKVGDHYYFGEGGQPCFGTDEDFQQESRTIEEIGTIRTKLSSIGKTVQPE